MSAADYLLSLARAVADGHSASTAPVAILLTGSVATGECDTYSDLDLIVYHDTLPDDAALREARQQIVRDDQWSAPLRDEHGVLELYTIGGVQCQVAHTLVARWEDEIAATLSGVEVAALSQKKLSGLLEGRPLAGAGTIERWQALAARYPDALARRSAEHYLGRIFPIWYFTPRLAARDATLWVATELVEGAQAVLGLLAALNRHYYAPFQFKYLRRFVGTFAVAPERLAERLEEIVSAPPSLAMVQFEELVRGTLALVREQMPEIDQSSLLAKLGARETPWTIASDSTQRGNRLATGGGHYPRTRQ